MSWKDEVSLFFFLAFLNFSIVFKKCIGFCFIKTKNKKIDPNDIRER